MKNLALFMICFFPCLLYSQNWIDTIYSIQTDTNLIYGTATDFAGTERALKLDISYPTNDSPAECGRPLLMMIHGGGWVDGEKDDANPRRIREDFAKRGYVTASISYRLGQFHTNLLRDCILVDGWKCLNMTDSSEWYRANYRAIQDANGALRFLIQQADDYNVDTNNVFVVGESAGGFVAMGVGFLDDPSEVLDSLIGSYPDAPRPNDIYEQKCIRQLNLAVAIDSMDLSRPALGDYQGDLNLDVADYTIRAVGNFYGGAFNNIFQSFSGESPALYMFHQPCDLVVPFHHNRVFAGFVNCTSGLCGGVINRPFVYGSRAIKTLLDTMQANAISTADYLFEQSTNQFNCFQQTQAGLACHAIDAFWTRTTSMASFFADKIAGCVVASEEPTVKSFLLNLYPNPVQDIVTVELDAAYPIVDVQVISLLGEQIRSSRFMHSSVLQMDVRDLEQGVYLLRCSIGERVQTFKITVF